MFRFSEKGNAAIVSMISVVVLAVAGIGGWFYYENIYWGAGNTFKRTQTQLIDTNSSHFNGSIDASSPELGVKASGEGDADLSDMEKAKLQATLNVTVTSQGVSFGAKGEVRAVDGELFVNASEMPALFGNTDKIKNMWIRFSKKTLSETVGQDLEKCVVSKEKQAELKKFIKEQVLIIEGKKAGKEKIGEKSARKFTGKISKEALAAILEKQNEALPESCRDKNFKGSDQLKDVSDITVTLWTSGDTVRVLVDFTIRGGNTSTVVKIDLTLSKFNQTVNVTKPDGAKDFETVAAELFGGFELMPGDNTVKPPTTPTPPPPPVQTPPPTNPGY